ncbi:MAG: hypothetical protein K0R82_1121 [Flavipsychrobacter sp.]|jgi:hypothetical protein|nr:hypothetical protein [Flavipsychrobacter sp.]
MNGLKQMLLTNWHLMRTIRLVLGLFIGAAALAHADAMMGLFSAFFLFQAVTDTGCCGSAACAQPSRKSDNKAQAEIEYEEIK